MSAKCGSQGPMRCMNGATCNETLGICESCPTGYMDDQAMFQGNINCGLSYSTMTSIYLVATIVSTLVSFGAFTMAWRKKHSRMRTVLIIVGVWVGLIPFYMLAHWLEGYRHGVVASFFVMTILCLVNTQVSIYNYTLESFLDLVGNKESNRRFHVLWYVLWIFVKVVNGLFIVVSIGVGDVKYFNDGIIALYIGLTIEVSANTFRGYMVKRRLIKAIADLRSTLQSNAKNSVIMEFAQQVAKTNKFAPIHSLIFVGFSVAMPVLYVVFDSSVPYAFVMWAIIVFLWPMIGIVPMILLRTKLGKQMERTDSKQANGEVTGAVGDSSTVKVKSDNRKTISPEDALAPSFDAA